MMSQQLAELYRINPDFHFTLDRKMLQSLPDKKEWYEVVLETVKNILAVYLELLKDFVKNFPNTMSPDYMLPEEITKMFKNLKK